MARARSTNRLAIRAHVIVAANGPTLDETANRVLDALLDGTTACVRKFDESGPIKTTTVGNLLDAISLAVHSSTARGGADISVVACDGQTVGVNKPMIIDQLDKLDGKTLVAIVIATTQPNTIDTAFFYRLANNHAKSGQIHVMYAYLENVEELIPEKVEPFLVDLILAS